MATLYTTDGKAKIVQPKQGNSFTVDELKGLIGGDFECKAVGPNYMLTDKEADNVLPNKVGTDVYQHWYNSNDVIFGTVLLLTMKEMGE